MKPWRAVLVLPQARRVLETQLRKLAPDAKVSSLFILPSSFKVKRAGGVSAPPARAISTKNKHLLVIYAIPTRGFTAAVSVFMGTPPAKPLKCKAFLFHLGALMSTRRADPNGGQPLPSCA